MRLVTKRTLGLIGLLTVVVATSASGCKEDGDYGYSLALSSSGSWSADQSQQIGFTVSGRGAGGMTTCDLLFVADGVTVQQLRGTGLDHASERASGSVTLPGDALPARGYSVQSQCYYTKGGKRLSENSVGVSLVSPSPSPTPTVSPSASVSASPSATAASTPAATANGTTAPAAPTPAPVTPSTSTPSTPAAPSAPDTPSAPGAPIPPG